MDTRQRAKSEFDGALVAGVGVSVIIALAVAWWLAGSIFGYAIWMPWAANMQTEVTRNTNQYVETQRTEIMGLVRQHDGLEQYEQTEEINRQQKNLVYQMCDAASKIDRQYVPDSAVALMSKEGC